MTRKTDPPEDLSDSMLDDVAGGGMSPAAGADADLGLTNQQGPEPVSRATKMPGMKRAGNVTLKRG